MSGTGLQLVMHAGERILLTSRRAGEGDDVRMMSIFDLIESKVDFFGPSPGQIRELLNRYVVESTSGTYDYARALADFTSRDENIISFFKGDIIAVVPKEDAYTDKVSTIPKVNNPISNDDALSMSPWTFPQGWLYGIKDGQFGLFPSDFVERMSPRSVRREINMVSKVTNGRPSVVDGRRRPAARHSDDEEDLEDRGAGHDDDDNDDGPVNGVGLEPETVARNGGGRHGRRHRGEASESELDDDDDKGNSSFLTQNLTQVNDKLVMTSGRRRFLTYYR